LKPFPGSKVYNDSYLDVPFIRGGEEWEFVILKY
jgi:hypothetical protein